VKLESVDYLGKRAVKITEDGQVANGEAYAIVKDAVFHNGEIEVELCPSASRSVHARRRRLVTVRARGTGGVVASVDRKELASASNMSMPCCSRT
jgi:hypothetical protein